MKISGIKTKFLNWLFVKRHGCNREEYAIREWNKTHINTLANNISDYYYGFEYIVEVNPWKVLNDHPILGYSLKPEIREQYCYPIRKLGDHMVYDLARGGRFMEKAGTTFEFNDFGYDTVFIATNNKDDAIIIALKYK